MGADDKDEATTNLKADVLSILTFNKKRYEEMYRIFLVADNDFPFIYNYDMTETTGAQHSETLYGATQDTKGAQTNTIGERTDSHNTAPFNSTTAILESSDVASQQQNTEGQRVDSSTAHTDEYDSDEWTLHRQGNIGTQNAANIAEDFTAYWTEMYKFMKLIFDDICKQLLFVGD